MRKAMCGLAVFAAALAHAQVPPAPGPIEIHRTTAPITVDGDLSDAGWQNAVKLDQWIEGQPGNNTPAKVKTTGYLTYDDKYFYIGVRCDDPDASKIRAPYVERDGVIGTDDNIAIFLDTRGDKRSALELRVNPRGIQADGFYDDAGPVEDFSPDYFYDTAARIDSTGWSAEFRIPFSSLRYSSRNPTFNILFWRNYPRDFRYGFYTAPLPRGSNCLVCHTVEIRGLTDLPEAGHLTVAPYVSSQRLETAPVTNPGSLDDRNLESNIGADLKWTPTANGAVDLTINPDFSQVEADVPQITVNQRFAVFFPEKRPFFLEGFDLFNTPLQVAYTRTITSPRAGLRSTARVGDTTYTVLAADDRGGGLAILPGPLGNDFALQDFRSYATIARARHELGLSFVGGIFTDREISGGGHNRVIGPDFVWRPNESNSVTGQFLYSDTQTPNRPDLSSDWRGNSLKSHAAFLNFNHQTNKYDYFTDVRDLGNDFRADLGFIPQVGIREYDGGAGVHFFPEKGWLRHLRPGVFYDRQNDTDGDLVFEQTSISINVQGVKNLAAGIALRPREKARVGDKVLDQTYWNFAFQIDPSRRFTRITLNGHAGDSIDFANARVGRGAALALGATLRPIDRITLDLLANREFLDAQGGRVFTAQVERIRGLYSFSANSIIRVIGQYVTTERDPARYKFPVDRHSGNFLGSVLYSYKVNWQTVLFVGYGDTRTITPENDLLKSDRSLFFKVSYAYQR